jgi:hypothetical protein
VKKIDLVQTISLLANLGVIAGIIFLAVELQQNTNALYGEARQTVLEAALQELFAVVDSPGISLSLTKSGSLSEAEQVSLDAYLSATLRAREFAWLESKAETIDEAQWNTEHAVLMVILDSSRARDWWGLLGRHYFSEVFVRFVDKEMADNPPTDTLWQGARSWAN